MRDKRFLIVVIFIFLSSCNTIQKNKNKFLKHPLSIVQGTTDSTQTFISILSKKKQGNLKFFVSRSGSFQKPIQILSYFKKKSPDGKWVIERIHIKNLKNFIKYKLLVKVKGKIIDERSFQTLNLKRENIRIGVVSCMDDRISSANKMWESYLNRFLDINFFIGDNVYADRLDDGSVKIADEKQLWQRYIQTWGRLYFYHSSQLSPTYYLWDDHDYGKNDGDASYVHKKVSAEIFWTFNPNEEITGVYQKTFGVGSILNAFNQKFLFLDGRFFRENQRGVHWGFDQKKKVLDEIRASRAKINWMIQGDQFFGAYHPFESFERDNPKEFKNTLESLKKTNKKIVFISGDRHLTEIMKIKKAVLGYKTFEITSSGIHAKVFPKSFLKFPNPRGEVGKSGVYNYTVIELYRDGEEKKQFKVTSYGAKDWMHYTKELSL